MPNTPKQIIENANILWDENGAPYSSRFEDIYCSRDGGLKETEHVFLAANHLRERWQELDRQLAQTKSADPANRQSHFTITELGFGTGLNFLCCWQLWQQTAPHNLRLHYIACEKYPLQSEVLAQAMARWPELASLNSSLLRGYPDHTPGYHRLKLSPTESCDEVILDLYYGDAQDMLREQATSRPNQQGIVDAWFLDGFAPRVNPDMWSPALLGLAGKLSKRGATLSTYSVAANVVAALQNAGFATRKQPGFGSKRHMLTGAYMPSDQARTETPTRRSWLALPKTQGAAVRCIVIGAGLAGSSVAASLAQRGCQVTIMEQAQHIAAGASGNRQAVLQCRLNNANTAAWQFNLQSFIYAAREFSRIQRDQHDIKWHACGVLNLDTAFSARKQRCAEVRLERYAATVVQRLQQEAGSQAGGLALDGAVNMIPLGGWLDPSALCHAYLQHPLISIRTNTKVTRLAHEGGLWHIFSQHEEGALASAEVLVIANSYLACGFEQTATLPLVPLRGQVTYLQESAISQQLAAVVCGQSYISPSHEGLHSAGASYSKDISMLEISSQEHTENIAGIAKHLPLGAINANAIRGGRVSVRASTGDRMPIVGPAVDLVAMERLYLQLQQRERQNPSEPVPFLPGLYLSVGHGSHGMSHCPLAAEYLASLICEEALPVQHAITQCLHPARFLLRQLRRK